VHSERVFAVEILLRKLLANHYRIGLLQPVLRREHAPAQQRNSKRMKISRIGHASERVWHILSRL
jgi:hypothetical protein